MRIQEAINVPPHMPQQWLKNVYEKAKHLEKRLTNPYIISDAANVESREIREKHYFQKLERQSLPYLFKDMLADRSDLMTQRINYYDLVKDDPGYSIKAFRNINLYDYYNAGNDYGEGGMLDDWLSTYEELQSERYDQDELVGYVEDGTLNEYQYRKLKNAMIVSDAIANYLKFSKQVAKNMQAIDERARSQSVPSHDPVETLYHATPFVREILSDGFKTKEEVGHEVLGGATDKAISFTADYNIAEAIVDSLIDVIRISKGSLSLGELLMIARAEGIDVRDFKSFLQDYKYYKKQGKATDSEVAFEFYKHYLMHSKTRYNPMFFGVTVDSFKHLKESNVGIIAADVDMAGVVRYLRAMEEYRVPVKAISNVRKAD